MQKINRAKTEKSIEDLLTYSNVTKKRKFSETIELQVGLKNFDPTRDKRFAGSIKLPFVPRPRLKVCVIADEQHITQCEELNIPFVSSADIKKLNKNKKAVTQLAKKYDAFLASETILKTLPRIAGPWFTKTNKFPAMLTHNDDVLKKIEEIKATIKFQMKKVLCLNVPIAHVQMNQNDVYQNIVLAINFLVSLLKKNWQNIKSVHIKSTMGPSFRLY